LAVLFVMSVNIHLLGDLYEVEERTSFMEPTSVSLPFRPSVCEQATKQFVPYIKTSLQEFLTQWCRAGVRFVKISSVTERAWINFQSCFSYVSPVWVILGIGNLHITLLT